MEAHIGSRAYYDQDIYDIEISAMTSELWNFVGNANEIEKENDYFLANIGNRSIIVQRCSGQVKAFENVCRHRFSKIHLERSGNRKLVCPYHSWTYGKNGQLISIPESDQFPEIKKETMCEISLTQWQTSLCGSLIFIRKNSEGPSLKDFLGEKYSKLETISKSFGTLIGRIEFPIQANWKLIMENTLEPYHVNSVHPTSFARLGTHRPEISVEEEHVELVASLDPTYVKRFKRVDNALRERPIRNDKYTHYEIFPTLAIASTFGTSFSVSRLELLSPTKTQFISSVYFTKCDSSILNTIKSTLEESILKFNKQVFEEDAKAAEMVQLSVHQAEFPGIVGEQEVRMIPFQKGCAKIYEKYWKKESST